MQDGDRSRSGLVGRIALFVVGATIVIVLGVLGLVAALPSDSNTEPAVREECLPRVEVSDTRVGRGTELVVSSTGFRCNESVHGASSATVHLLLGELGSPLDDEQRMALIDVAPDGSFRAEVRVPAADVELTEIVGAYILVRGDAFRCRGDSCGEDVVYSTRLDYVPI